MPHQATHGKIEIFPRGVINCVTANTTDMTNETVSATQLIPYTNMQWNAVTPRDCQKLRIPTIPLSPPVNSNRNDTPHQVWANRDHRRCNHDAKRRLFGWTRGRSVQLHGDMSEGCAGDGLRAHRHMAWGRPQGCTRGRHPVRWKRGSECRKRE